MGTGNAPVRVEFIRQVLVWEWRTVDRLSAHAVAFRKVCGSNINVEGISRQDDTRMETVSDEQVSQREREVL